MSKAEVEKYEPQETMPMLMGNVNIEGLITKALEKESPLEVLDKLMSMRREMQADAAKSGYYNALAQFQAQVPIIPKNKKVHDKGSSNVRYSYASLDIIVSTIQPYLEKTGLSYTIEVEQTETSVNVICVSHHTLGYSQRTTFEIPIDPKAYMNAAQKVASALTFGKRYALCNALGILTGDEDDDSQAFDPANSAGAKREPVKMPERKKPERKKPSGRKPAENGDGPLIVFGHIEKYYKKNGKKPHSVGLGGQWYSTYSDALGQLMKELYDGNIPVRVFYEVNAKGYNDALRIEENIPVKETEPMELDEGEEEAPF